MRLVLCLACLPTLAWGGSQAVLWDHAAPAYTQFAQSAAELAETAQADCSVPAMLPAYHDTFDAWMGVSHITFGPIEEDGRALAIAFWPDSRDRVGRALGRLIATQDAAGTDPQAFAEVSVAAQGLFALERLLTNAHGDPGYLCTLRQTIASTLARNAADLNAAWPEFAADMFQLQSDRFQTQDDVNRTIYTALTTGLEFLDVARLGRPLGTFDRPRPARAEARRLRRSQRNVELHLTALRDLTMAFASEGTDETQRLFTVAIDRAQALGSPDFAAVADPAKRFRIEALQQIVRDLRVAVDSEIGARLNILAGFNSLDGD